MKEESRFDLLGRAKHMELCRPESKLTEKSIYEHSLTVFKTWSYFCKKYVTVSKRCIARNYLRNRASLNTQDCTALTNICHRYKGDTSARR